MKRLREKNFQHSHNFKLTCCCARAHTHTKSESYFKKPYIEFVIKLHAVIFIFNQNVYLPLHQLQISTTQSLKNYPFNILNQAFLHIKEMHSLAAFLQLISLSDTCKLCFCSNNSVADQPKFKGNNLSGRASWCN